jgi:hypothetical protein
MDPNLILHPEETSVSSLNVSSNIHPSESDSFKKTSSTEIKVVAESDSITVLGKGLETIGQAFKEISPAIAVGAITGGTATILNTLPPKERVGALLASSLVATGGYSVTKMMNSNSEENPKKAFLNESDRTDNVLTPSLPKSSPHFSGGGISVQESKSSVGEFQSGGPESPNSNSFINSPLENDIYSISSPFEFNSIEEGLTIGMILMIAGAFYGMTIMLINQFVRLLKLESPSSPKGEEGEFRPGVRNFRRRIPIQRIRIFPLP